MRSFWTYSLMRMLLLMGCLALFYVFGARGMFLLATAAIGSMLLSYLFLRTQRNRLIEDVRRKQDAAQESKDAEYEDGVLDQAEQTLDPAGNQGPLPASPDSAGHGKTQGGQQGA